METSIEHLRKMRYEYINHGAVYGSTQKERQGCFQEHVRRLKCSQRSKELSVTMPDAVVRRVSMYVYVNATLPELKATVVVPDIPYRCNITYINAPLYDGAALMLMDVLLRMPQHIYVDEIRCSVYAIVDSRKRWLARRTPWDMCGLGHGMYELMRTMDELGIVCEHLYNSQISLDIYDCTEEIVTTM
jgi:hypothetical protein